MYLITGDHMGLNKESIDDFEMIDPFNPQNTVKGQIFKMNERYGDLQITHVNGKFCEQYIHTTPKFFYPGKTSSLWKYSRGTFPAFTEAFVYDKLDGTNICMFRYMNAEGKEFTSFKTRLVPFLRESKWGNWVKMWQKIMATYPYQYQELLEQTQYNFGFEMYGSVNKILVLYPIVLDGKLLYAIDRYTGKLSEPSIFQFPKPDLLDHFNANINPDDKYDEWMRKYNDRVKPFVKEVEGKNDDGEPMMVTELIDIPCEGCMFYLKKTDGEFEVYKCKPSVVITAQSSANEGPKRVGYNEVWNTALNAMENVENIEDLPKETYKLLLEEYTQDELDVSKEAIDEAIKEVQTHLIFQNGVIEKFKTSGLTWSKENKGQIMRYMMQYYPKSDSSKVYNALVNYTTMF